MLWFRIKLKPGNRPNCIIQQKDMSIQQYLTEQNDNGSTSRWKIIRQTYSGGTASPTIQAPGKNEYRVIKTEKGQLIIKQ